VSISLYPEDVEKMDRNRGIQTRSHYIQLLIDRDDDRKDVSELSTKALLSVLSVRDDLPRELTRGFLETVMWGMDE
jgi:hypothetical protein